MHHQMYPARVEGFLHDLCVVLGICLDANQRQSLLDDPPAEIEAFADAAMRAEQLDPNNPKWANLRRRACEVCKPHFEEFWQNAPR